MPATNFARPFHGYIVGRLIEWVSVSILSQSTLEAIALDTCKIIVLLSQAHIRPPVFQTMHYSHSLIPAVGLFAFTRAQDASWGLWSSSTPSSTLVALVTPVLPVNTSSSSPSIWATWANSTSSSSPSTPVMPVSTSSSSSSSSMTWGQWPSLNSSTPVAPILIVTSYVTVPPVTVTTTKT